MSVTSYKNEHVQCDVSFLSSHEIRIVGSIVNPGSFQQRILFAAAPIDRMMNYSGSGLPFPSADVAFDNTPNQIQIDRHGMFDVVFKYPNAYYKSDFFEKMLPSIFFSLLEYGKAQPFYVQFTLPDPLPLRTLGYRPNHEGGPIYYAAKENLLPIASAQDTMLYYADAKARYDIA